jgi:hypothetical protein
MFAVAEQEFDRFLTINSICRLKKLNHTLREKIRKLTKVLKAQ